MTNDSWNSSPPVPSPTGSARSASSATRKDESSGPGSEEDEDQEHDDGTDGAAKSALLHFSSPRDTTTIAAFLRTRVYRPESLVWLQGYQTPLRWRKENQITSLHAVPYDVEVEVGATKTFLLGRWIHQQRKALRAGELEPRRKELLDAPDAGMVWEPGEETWENKLAVFRAYRQATGHLAPRQDAVWGQGEATVPVGQHITNLRRKSGLGKNPERAAERAAQLTAIDEDWNCPGHSTGNATTGSSPNSPPTNPTADSPTSHPAYSWTATTSANGSSSSVSRAPGRCSYPSSRNG